MNFLQRINAKLVGLVVAALFALSAMAPFDTPPKALLNAVATGVSDVFSPKLRLGNWQAPLPASSRAEELSLDAAAALFTQHAAGAPELSTMAPGAIDACQQLRNDAAPTATLMICRASGGVEAATSGIEQAQQSLIGRAEAAQQSIVARTGLNPFWIGGSNVIGADLQELAGPGRIVGEGVRPFELGPLTAVSALKLPARPSGTATATPTPTSSSSGPPELRARSFGPSCSGTAQRHRDPTACLFSCTPSSGYCRGTCLNAGG